MKLSSVLRTAVSGSLAVLLSIGLAPGARAGAPRGEVLAQAAAVAASPIEIWIQPDSQSLSSPGQAYFYVIASGDSLRYQWQQRRPGAAWQSIRGAGQDNLTVQAGLAQSGLQYRVLISSGSQQISSHIVWLRVIGYPQITRQPNSVRGAEGGRVTLRAAATGNQIHYRWQRRSVGGAWTTLPGAVQSSLIVMTHAGNHGAQYRLLADNPNGRAISNPATITVVFNKVRITSQPRSTGVNSGQVATFRVGAVGSGARYQWQRVSGGKWVIVAGATGSSYGVRTSPARNGWTFRVVVSNRSGSVTSQSVRLGVAATRSDPWKVGTSVTLQDWRVRQTYVNANARSWVATKGFSQTPAAGKRYVAATFVVTNFGAERSDPFWDLNVELVGTDGRTYGQVFDYVTGFDQISVGTVYRGGSAWFTAVAEVPTGVAGGSWSVQDTSDYSDPRETWFAGR